MNDAAVAPPQESVMGTEAKIDMSGIYTWFLKLAIPAFFKIETWFLSGSRYICVLHEICQDLIF